MTTSTNAIQQAPLHLLSIDERANVRKKGRGVSEPPFVGSITAKGIIEPLVVRKNGKGYMVVNGGKRCAALAYMSEHGIMAQGVPVTPDYQVPIIVRDEDDAAARDTSLITNIVRADMHPVDQYEAFADQVRAGRKPADLAAMYGIDVKRVEQALALGDRLVPAAREAWRDGRIGAAIAQALTLAPDQKAQERVLAKALKEERFDADDVHREFKIKGDVGLMLDFIGIEAYEARGGLVERDLFGTNHRASNEKLVKAMHGEKLEALADEMVKAGWAFAKILGPNEYAYDHGRIQPKERPTDAERKRLDELDRRANDYELADAEQRSAEIEHNKLSAEILARSFTADMKAKSGVLIEWDGDRGLKLDYGRTKPEEKKRVEAQERAAERKKKTEKAKKEGAPGVISNALHQRLSEQLTAAVAKAIASDSRLALPAILAGFAAAGTFGGFSDGGPVKVQERGMTAAKGERRRSPAKFATALAGYAKLKLPDQLAALAEVAATAIDMQEQHVDHKPLKDADNVALIEALNSKAFNEAMRSAFDAKDYFDAVSKDMCLAAIAEAVNADEARKLAGRPKAEVAKFAVANVPKTGWLPPELRTVHYDGASAKAKAAAKSRLAPKKKGT